MSGDVDIHQIIFLALPSAMLLGSIFAALLAPSKGRNATYWMIWSFLFPPTVLLLLFMSRVSNKKRPPRRSEDDENDGMGSFILP